MSKAKRKESGDNGVNTDNEDDPDDSDFKSHPGGSVDGSEAEDSDDDDDSDDSVNEDLSVETIVDDVNAYEYFKETLAGESNARMLEVAWKAKLWLGILS